MTKGLKHSLMADRRVASPAKRGAPFAKEERLIRQAVKQIIHIHREAFKELEKY